MARSAGLSADQRHHFFKTGHLLLQGILGSEQCSTLAHELLKVWSGRFGGSPKTDFVKAHQMGRDLWRDSQSWSSKLIRSPIGSLALQLWSRTSLRLLYDQLLIATPHNVDRDIYRSFSLESSSAFGGIEGGIAICLQSPERALWHLSLDRLEQTELGEKRVEIAMPHEVGTGVFAASDTLLRLNAAASCTTPTSGVWMLVVFGRADSTYIFNQKDLSRHEVAASGYFIGDRLRDDTHPLIRSTGGATIR